MRHRASTASRNDRPADPWHAVELRQSRGRPTEARRRKHRSPEQGCRRQYSRRETQEMMCFGSDPARQQSASSLESPLRGGEARSVQAKFPADGLEFRWLNQICMGNRDGMQRTIEFARPEVQKSPQFGKVRVQVVKLPDKALQDARMIGHPIENISGGQTKTFELAAKIVRDHVASVVSGAIVSASPAVRKRRNIEFLIDFILLAAHEIECQFFSGPS